MKKLIINNSLFIIIFVTIYFPFILFGEFIKDDWFLYKINKLDTYNAIKSLVDSFSNRPIAIFFYFVMSRISDKFLFYFFINFLLLFFSYNILINSLNPFIKNLKDNFEFTCLFLLPAFSTTVIFSTGMQLIGNLSLLLWSLSLYFKLRYLKNNNKKDLIYFLLFIFLIFFTYESSLPLIGLSAIFIYFYKPITNKNKKFIKIFISLIILIFIVVLIQKFLIPYYTDDISRLRINPKNYIFIIKIFLANILLIINSFFSLFILLPEIIFDLRNNQFAILHIIFMLILYIVVIKSFYKVSKNLSTLIDIKFLILSFILVIFLVALMHTFANTGVRVFGYNNRGLLAISYLIPIFFLLLKNTNFRKKKFITYLQTFFIINFLIIVILTQYSYINFTKYIHNNAINVIENKKFKINEKFIIFFDDSYSKKYKLIDHLTPLNNTLQFGTKIRKLSNGKIDGIYLNTNMACNEEFFVKFLKKTILDNIENKKTMYLITYINLKLEKISFADKSVLEKINNIKKCSKNLDKSNDFIRSFANEKLLYDYNIIEYESFFVKFLIRLYLIIFN
jgi:hypothetical protein